MKKKRKMKKNKNENLKEEMEQKENLDQEKKEEKKSSFEEEIAALKKEVEQWKEKAYRTAADCDNLRKSYEKDHENLLKYRGIGFVEKLLPALDAFHISLMVKPSDPNLQNYVKGFEMIYRQILTALEQEGVKQVAPKVGDPFNADSMQAVDVKISEENDKVLEVFSNGYLLKDRLVRPAMVVVSKAATIKEQEQEESKE